MNIQNLQRGIDGIVARKEKIWRFLPLIQIVVGTFLLLFGWRIGKGPYFLITKGSRTQGQIVAYHQRNLGQSAHSAGETAFMPVVQFTAPNGSVIRFENWMGSRWAMRLHDSVNVLYDPRTFTTAMIDRPVWNWIPWGPIMLVGMFLVLVSLRGLAANQKRG